MRNTFFDIPKLHKSSSRQSSAMFSIKIHIQKTQLNRWNPPHLPKTFKFIQQLDRTIWNWTRSSPGRILLIIAVSSSKAFLPHGPTTLQTICFHYYYYCGCGCWLLAIAYWLLAIGYWLLAIGYWLLAIAYWLLAVGYWPLAIGYKKP